MPRVAVIRGVTLKVVSAINVQFCPFEERVRGTRQFLSYMGNENMRATNPKCKMTTTIKNDRSDPIIDVTFSDGSQLVFKSKNLTNSEILNRFSKHIKEKFPEDYKEALL
ncbi:large ribosomal subunit protein mL53-like [Saccoglossus kowalevskii]|uniref:Large ribosomal subunit protein mL53 n=1 Tax=Saccoglossus kowalevskii TaxID=10224 RepID=A0ABM0GVT0_SACKO|nr:PREDICTED: 39S ribosomal protein L53, mitochondrial-like [Saccoglossus kowalevskii]